MSPIGSARHLGVATARLLGVALLTLSLGPAPARAAEAPAPVEDPGGLLLPECGTAGALTQAWLRHKVRSPAPARRRPPPVALAPLPEARAWQAFLACTRDTAAEPERNPLRRT
jgi:hypothetical protein